MKRCCSFLLVICLAYGAGLPLFAQEDPGLLVMEEPQERTKIKLTENLIIIENLPTDETLEIYNIMGMKVYNRRVKAGTNQYTLSLPKGYYIIKIGKLTRKIAVK